MNLFMKDVKYCGAQFALTRPGKRRVGELATKCAIEMQKRKEVTKRKYVKKEKVVEKRKYTKRKTL